MHEKYPRVFSPIKIGPVELKNRFYASPHAMPMNIRGKPTDDYVQYNVARAKGGLGLLMLSLTIPERTMGAQSRPSSRENIPAFRALTDAVHEAGAKIFGEPFYQWMATGAWLPFSPPAPSLGPSVAQYSFMDRRSATRAMTSRDIREMLQAIGDATANLREAGLDGVMLHVSHGALLQQFLSPYFNRRTDAYGGGLDNRMRLLVEALEIAREAAGESMAVGIRLNCDELLDGGYDTNEAQQVLKSVADAGLIDFADLDVAVEPEQFHLGMPPVFVEPHVYAPYVEAVRGAAGSVPILSVLGRLTSVADGEAFLQSGLCDMVGIARASIAEPELLRNAFEGREEQSRTCIACNACMAGALEGMQICAINPATYRERLWGPHSFLPAPQRSKVVVVGSGPAGLEAARVSALRGHDVTLFEERNTLGGALALWAKLPDRAFYARAIEWWQRELVRLGVSLRTGVRANSNLVMAAAPDAVIVATGAVYSRTGRSNHADLAIPGHDRSCVLLPEDILLGKAMPTGKIVVLDAEGNHTGVGLAEALARDGADVEFVTPYFSPTSSRLIDTQDAWFIVKRLLASGVTLTPISYIRRIGDRQVTLYNVHSGEERVIDKVDAVVLSTGRLPVNGLEEELRGRVRQLFTVGDALAPRVWSAAAFEGQKFARCIGEDDAPTCVEDAFFGADDLAFVPIPADLARA